MIFWVGDSHSVAMAQTLAAEARSHGDTITVRARNGASAADWIADGIVREIRSSDADVVVVALGSNDGQAALAHVDPLLNAAKGIGARFYWVAPPDANAVIEDPLEEKLGRDAVISFYNAARGLERAPDNVHLRTVEYPIAARRLMADLYARIRTSRLVRLGVAAGAVFLIGSAIWAVSRIARDR